MDARAERGSSAWARMTSSRMSLGCGLCSGSVDALDRSTRPSSSANVTGPASADRGHSCSRSARGASPRARRRRRALDLGTSSPGSRLSSRPRVWGTMQYAQTQLQPSEICTQALELALALCRQVSGEVLEVEVALRRQRVLRQELGQLVDLPRAEGDVHEREASKTSSLTDCAQQPPTPTTRSGPRTSAAWPRPGGR